MKKFISSLCLVLGLGSISLAQENPFITSLEPNNEGRISQASQEDSEKLFQLGEFLARDGDLEGAFSAFTRAVEKGHGQVWRCYYHMAYLSSRLNDRKATEYYFQRAFDAEQEVLSK